MLKIFADECVHTDLIKAIKSLGVDIITTQETKLSGKSDEDIFNYCVKSNRILLTFDRGFGDIFRFDIATSEGVVILLISRMKKEEILGIATSFFKKYQNKNLKGKLVIIGKTRVRILKR